MLIEPTEAAAPEPDAAIPEAVHDYAVSRSPAIFHALDRSQGGRVTFISATVEALTGHHPNAFLADPDFLLQQVHPDDRHGFLRAMDAEIGDDGLTRSFRLLKSDGEPVWVRDTLHRGAGAGDLLRFPKGAIVNFVLRYVKRAVPRFRLANGVSFRHALRAGSKELARRKKM